MKDASSQHLKVQEFCDCFTANDPLKEMSEVKKETDYDEAALKWIALAVLHGINSNAEEISITNSENGVEVNAQYRKADLPSPGTPIAEKIITALRDITHIEDTSGESILAFGLRNNSMDLKIKSVHERGDEKLTIVFP